MGLFKKIFKPVSKVLDKIIPNEIKPALPFLAAAAPFMAPGIMGAFGNSMLSRGLISGGLNLGAQLAQEGVWNLHAYNLAKLMRQDQLAELILQNHPIKKNIN